MTPENKNPFGDSTFGGAFGASTFGSTPPVDSISAMMATMHELVHSAVEEPEDDDLEDDDIMEAALGGLDMGA